MSNRNTRTIRIGSRGSALALKQVDEAVSKVKKCFPSIKFKVVIIRTSGDRFSSIKDISARSNKTNYAGKGLFVKEIESALLCGRIDMAVHSLKDVPQKLARGLKLAAFLKRGDRYDVFVSDKYKGVANLPFGAIVGTSAPRRSAQIKSVRPDLKIVELRGNVETRLEKMRAGICDATILAAAGLKRLGIYDKIEHKQVLKNIVPAIGQGVICIETKVGNTELDAILRRALNDENTETGAIAERAFLNFVGGDCHTPIAAIADVRRGGIKMTGFVSSKDGKRTIQRSCVAGDPWSIGNKLGKEFVKLGARRLLGLGRVGLPKRIVLTGLPETNAHLMKKLRGRFDEFIEMPLIGIKPPSDGYARLKRAIKELSSFDRVIFTSKNSVKAFAQHVKNNKKFPNVAAVGSATKEELVKYGFKDIVAPKREDSKALLELLSKKCSGKKVLILKAENGLKVLEEGLKMSGAFVRTVPAYRTVHLKPKFKDLPADTIFFTSPSTVTAFKRYFKGKKIKALCMGKTTTDHWSLIFKTSSATG